MSNPILQSPAVNSWISAGKSHGCWSGPLVGWSWLSLRASVLAAAVFTAEHSGILDPLPPHGQRESGASSVHVWRREREEAIQPPSGQGEPDKEWYLLPGLCCCESAGAPAVFLGPLVFSWGPWCFPGAPGVFLGPLVFSWGPRCFPGLRANGRWLCCFSHRCEIQSIGRILSTFFKKNTV